MLLHGEHLKIRKSVHGNYTTCTRSGIVFSLRVPVLFAACRIARQNMKRATKTRTHNHTIYTT